MSYEVLDGPSMVHVRLVDMERYGERVDRSGGPQVEGAECEGSEKEVCEGSLVLPGHGLIGGPSGHFNSTHHVLQGVD